MNILHITSHMGGGVGTVIMGWVDNDKTNTHKIMLLDYANEKSIQWANEHQVDMSWNERDKSLSFTNEWIEEADVVICHIYENPMMDEFLSRPIPDCRLVFWCHKNYDVPAKVFNYPDRYYNTSPVQGAWDYIWSTGDMKRFLKLEKKAHEGFNVGTVVSPKLHDKWFDMCREIKRKIPDSYFTILGGGLDPKEDRGDASGFTFVGKVDDVAPYLAECDVFFYPLRPDHYGTAEQALGEAMSAGVVPVAMDNPAERLICGDHTARTTKEAVRMVELLYEHPEIREISAPFARETAKKLYAVDTMIKQWNGAFVDMMKEPKQGRGVL